MEQRQEMSPEMQIFLIASDVDEVKSMVKKLEGTVAEIHISLISTDDKPGVFEQLRQLATHTHPEVDALRTELRIFNAKVGATVIASVTLIDLALRVWGPR